MLNISNNSINNAVKLEDFSSSKLLRKSHVSKLTTRLVLGLFIGLIFILFLPWTQNINAKGSVTTRNPEQRPQTIQSVISGQIEKWYVKEGDFLRKGDTLVYIREVKPEYFDPELIQRTAEQLDAKSQSIVSYDLKIQALQQQYAAINKALDLKERQIKNKLIQTRNKIRMDSIDLVAERNKLALSENQLDRTQKLYDQGLKSLTELQEKQYKAQDQSAKLLVQQNKLQNQKRELYNLELELQTTRQDYADKLAKSMSSQQSAVSSRLESVGSTSKLKNNLSNYSERQKFYYITAPQDGYFTRSQKKGVGELLKEGSEIATIMPSTYELAIQIYVKPEDIPLLAKGDRVQIRFDGWPAIVLRGWPKGSTGVFTGKVVAIDKFIDPSGKYRVMVSPMEGEKKWPEMLSIGTGANAFLLLNKVPIWYEIWRQLNGFPPDFYTKDELGNEKIYRKAPIKSVK